MNQVGANFFEGELELIERIVELDLQIEEAKKRVAKILPKTLRPNYEQDLMAAETDLARYRTEWRGLWQVLAGMYPDIFGGQPYVPDEDPPTYRAVLRPVQHWLISVSITDLCFDRFAIPRSGVVKLMKHCREKYPNWFRSDQSFRHAWRTGHLERSDEHPEGRWRVVNEQKYAHRKHQPN